MADIIEFYGKAEEYPQKTVDTLHWTQNAAKPQLDSVKVLRLTKLKQSDTENSKTYF